jgi:hypothetical protein
VTKPAGLAATMSEDDLLEAVIQLGRALCWKTAHFRPARTETGYRTAVQGDGKGFPDLVMVHPGRARILVVELKSETGRTTIDQDAWLAGFESALAGRVFVWRPRDWLDGSIEAELRAP